MKSVFGTMSWHNGDKDLQNGQGKLTKKNKDVYEGQFKNGEVEGLVIIHYVDGSKFKGNYHNGKRNGSAIEETANGVRFEGNYKDNQRDGKFIERDKNGKITAVGYYENGKRHVN